MWLIYELPQRVTHTKTSSREDLFIETYSILQNHLPEPVPKQFFHRCGYCEAPEGPRFMEL